MESIKKTILLFILTATLICPSSISIAHDNGPIAAVLILENESPSLTKYSKNANFSKSKKAISLAKKAQKRNFFKKKRSIMRAVILGSVLLALIGVGLIALLIILVSKAIRIKKAFKSVKGMSRGKLYEKVKLETKEEYPNASGRKIHGIRELKEDIATMEVRIYIQKDNPSKQEAYRKKLRLLNRELAEYIKRHK